MARVKKSVGEVKGKTMPCLVLPGGTKYFNPTEDLEERLFSAYAEKFECGSVSGQSWLGQFVNQQMDTLKQNLKKDPNLALSTTREVNKIVRDTQNFYNSKKAVDVDFSKYLLRDTLFYYQKEVYDSPMKKKALCWGRRVGKTILAARMALKHCLEKEAKPRECYIIGLTLERTAELYWNELKDQIQKAHIITSKIDNGAYRITFPNNNFIQLWGNGSKTEAAKLRGKDASMVIIEEMQSEQRLFDLLENIVEPMIKARDGEIMCIGTAPLSAGTKWEEILGDDTYFHSEANMSMNPTIPNHERVLEEILEEKHWTADNPTFIREYLGKICYDSNLLIYPKVHYWYDLPNGFSPVEIYISCDLGWRDRSAVLTMAVDAFGNAFVTEEFCRSGCDGTTILNEIQRQAELAKEKWNVSNDQIHVVCDTNEQNLTQDWYNRALSNYICENAIKYELTTSYALVNEALSSGMLKIPEEGDCDWDCRKTVYKTDTETGKIIYDEDKKVWHEDAMAALRYAWGNYQSMKAQGS